MHETAHCRNTILMLNFIPDNNPALWSLLFIYFYFPLTFLRNSIGSFDGGVLHGLDSTTTASTMLHVETHFNPNHEMPTGGGKSSFGRNDRMNEEWKTFFCQEVWRIDVASTVSIAILFFKNRKMQKGFVLSRESVLGSWYKPPTLRHSNTKSFWNWRFF